MKTHHLAFLTALLFTVAAVMNFIKGNTFLGSIGILGAISFLLAGLHWRRKGYNKK